MLAEVARYIALKTRLVDTLGRNRARSIYGRIKHYFNGDEKVLEVGTGACYVMEFLERNKFDITGLDIKNLSFIEGTNPIIYDGKRIPFPTNHFDVSLLIYVLHHCKDPLYLLKEVRRVSRRIVIIENIYNNPIEKYLTYFWDSLVNLEFINHPHSNKTDKEWIEVYQGMGLRILDHKTDNPPGTIADGIYHLAK
jgi:ubiquinone/menaquinone biosynthesis C-methylase UbiE